MTDIISSVKYETQVDRAILAAYNGASSMRFRDLLHATAGAFPTFVAERVQKLALTTDVPADDEMTLDDSWPELHPLDFEWYFESSTSEYICSWLDSRTATLIGLPSVARHYKGCFTLVERNPFVKLRNTLLGGIDKIVVADVQSLTETSVPRADVIAFDPPWYLGETLLWLSKARALVKEGGEIGFALFPRLLRPSADGERDAILSFAKSIGHVQVYSSVLEYVTPTFESEAMKASGTHPINSWRRADFVTVKVDGDDERVERLEAAPLQREPWHTFRVDGGQVVKLRRVDRRRAGEVLVPINGTDGWRYGSVSLRDEVRDHIDIWTSRNRVARVGDRARVERQLSEFQRSIAPISRRFQQWDWVSRQIEAELWRGFLAL